MSYELDRLKFIARESLGEILDVGYAQNPNPFLTGEVTGIDIQKPINVKNYKKTISLNLNKKISLGDKSFDTIICGEVLEHLDNPVRLLKESHRLLKEKGKLIISIPHVYYWKEIWLNNFKINARLEKEHIITPTKQNIKTLCFFNGFRIIKEKSFCNSKIFKYLPLKPFFLKTTLLFVLEKEKKTNTQVFTKSEDLKRVEVKDE